MNQFEFRSQLEDAKIRSKMAWHVMTASILGFVHTKFKNMMFWLWTILIILLALQFDNYDYYIANHACHGKRLYVDAFQVVGVTVKPTFFCE
jgi:hypothetical protein